MRTIALLFAGLLVTAWAGLGIADPVASGYPADTQPLITGTIVSSNEHSIVVKGDDGEQTTLLIDSRTLLPAELPAGGYVKIEFHIMENGEYRALRVVPVWSREAEAEARAMSMGRVSGSHTAMALAAPGGAGESRTSAQGSSGSSAGGGYGAASAGESATEGAAPTGATRTQEERGSAASASGQGESTSGQGGSSSSGSERSLPKTASPEPLIAVAGLFALAAGASAGLLRRRLARERRD